MKEELFAFWKHDLYPYVLGAKITSMDKEGLITAEGYQTYKFRPIKILPFSSGHDLWLKIGKVCEEHKKAKNKFERDWSDKIFNLLEFL